MSAEYSTAREVREALASGVRVECADAPYAEWEPVVIATSDLDLADESGWPRAHMSKGTRYRKVQP